ncbi:hypothetical protein MWU75_19535, partial [Ornithinimicrobium sp. F0845]|uniref:hypothetical protein n=1 Tax=Ornithinimicrobium sp. F0845 TaxID=2926412 RepID=UPI001FF39E5E
AANPVVAIGRTGGRPCKDPAVRNTRVRATVVMTLVVVTGSVALFVASAVNWQAADNKCGALFSFDERFADAQEVSFENRLFPQPVDCKFDNGITVSHRWWPAASG